MPVCRQLHQHWNIALLSGMPNDQETSYKNTYCSENIFVSFLQISVDFYFNANNHFYPKVKFGKCFVSICCPHGLYPSCQIQSLAPDNNAHLSFLKTFPSAATFRTGISSILMFPISDSLKHISRRKERWRQAKREGKREEKSNSWPKSHLKHWPG